ncbi:hypothetical protein SY85_15405 [Flavisolibacter tropicus]|uniref:Outer membrane protein beta-barrel domain-containing protein n=2 Tax=Flavisolibacter tropicus TaxID=1492898 RepID=A0A172U2B9_9BACT|nr:hypothetical protein SY85_15405 [Flavisolibacter tropicus]
MTMYRKLLFFSLALFSFFFSQAQSFSISGRIIDAESRTALQGSSVLLRSIKDTTLSYSTFTDSTGRFQFDNIQRDSFRLTISAVGYETLSRSVRVDSANVVLANITVPRTSRELTGVTVTTRIPPAQQKGDTVQFNANQFKVNPDATAEELARKVPGITVENGQVKAQGENVRRVTIDGRELFGEDATAALRNLPAEIIDKIQVFDRLSDQAQFSGFDDGNTSKEINIVTKANMRNGHFGRVFAGYGTDDRYQAGGNATLLKGNRRISLVGNFNNINQQNFSQQDLLGVTSNAQRGGGGGGPRGGGGGPRGGSGNRGQGSGNQGGGNFGGFGSSGNFLVGQQNGINRTKAFGINYSDLWGKKVTVSASYFFNNTDNTTSELTNRQYYLTTIPNIRENNNNNSQNTNHRFNMRLEYRIDSSNQLIITPNLSFQNNDAKSLRNTLRFFNEGQTVSKVDNNRISDRAGNNLNNTILYRHSFPKKGRTFSVNLNTSYNKRDGDTYQQTFTTNYSGSTSFDTSDQQHIDQLNNGYQVSTNFVYTEPLWKNTQLQLNYNPTFSKSKSDQQAFRFDELSDKYSLFDTSLSNQFENKTRAQNGGISFRTGTRDNQFSAGVNYQNTNLNSDQVFPTVLQVNKTFQNILPNAMFRYKFSPKSNIRLMYRSSVNLPSVTQLAAVADITDRPFVTVGNPNLDPQYTHTFSGRYTFTNTAKGSLILANVFWLQSNNYITNATYVATKDSVISNNIVLNPSDELTVPINLDGYNSLRSFLTFAIPVRAIKSNVNINGGFTYNRFPGLINNVSNLANNYVYTIGTVIASNISQYVDFTVSYSANFNNVTNSIVKERNDSYFQHTAGLQLNLLSKKGWFFQNDLNNQYYSGLSAGYNQSFWLWNMGAGKKFLKDQKGELRFNVFDLLGQNRSLGRNVTETYIEDERNEVLQRYFMLTFTYNLRNFGTAAARAANRSGAGGTR